MLIGITLHGFVLKILWLWFVVSTFNLPPISVPQALGISLIAALMTHQARERLETVQEFTWVFIQPVFAIVIGFVLKLMM